MIVNVDPEHRQSGFVHLDMGALGIGHGRPFQVHDQLTGARYLWHGPHNYVELNPSVVPAHILQVHPRVRTERDFEMYQ